MPLELVKQTRELGRLSVVNFAAGGIATPADAAMMMQLGCDGVFVGSVGQPYITCVYLYVSMCVGVCLCVCVLHI